MRQDSPERSRSSSSGGGGGAETPQGPGAGVKAERTIWKILYELKLRTFPSTSRFAPETGKKRRLDFSFFFFFCTYIVYTPQQLSICLSHISPENEGTRAMLLHLFLPPSLFFFFFFFFWCL